jgi:hypothetical protein
MTGEKRNEQLGEVEFRKERLTAVAAVLSIRNFFHISKAALYLS